MKSFKALLVLDKFRFLFKNTKVDYEMMRKILEVKLTLDGRRASVFNKLKSDADEIISNDFLKSYGIYLLIGLFMIPLGFLGETPFIGLNLFFGILLFMLVSTMISDFSSVILDTKDKIILLTKPVSKETLTTARFIHILIYLLTLILVLAIPGILSFGYNYGIMFGVLLLFVMMLLSLLSILGTSFIYTILMKFFQGEKLKDVINIFQIFFILTLNIGYQLVIRMFSYIDFKFIFIPKWWSYLLPPAWFAALFQMIFFSQYQIEYIILSILAITLPIIALVIHIKVIAPKFEQRLSKLDVVEKSKLEKKGLRYKISEMFEELIARTSTEKTFLKFTKIMLKKERSVKFKVYPILAFSIMFPIIFIVSNYFERENISFLLYLKDRDLVLFLYLGTIMVTQIITFLPFSDSYKGAWLYNVMPISEKEDILKGSVKGLLITYILPVVIGFTVFGISLYGIYALLDLTLIFSATFISMMLIYKSNSKMLPFSEKYSQKIQSRGSFESALISMGITGVFFGVHKFIHYKTMYLMILTILVIMIDFIIWKIAFKGQWESNH